MDNSKVDGQKRKGILEQRQWQNDFDANLIEGVKEDARLRKEAMEKRKGLKHSDSKIRSKNSFNVFKRIG
jgi:hypothetical protein